MHRLQCSRFGGQGTPPVARQHASYTTCSASRMQGDPSTASMLDHGRWMILCTVGAAAAMAHTVASTQATPPTPRDTPRDTPVTTRQAHRRALDHALCHLHQQHHATLTTRHMLVMHTNNNMAYTQQHIVHRTGEGMVAVPTADLAADDAVMTTTTTTATDNKSSASRHPTPSSAKDPRTPLKVLAAAAALAVALGAMRAMGQHAARQRMLERRPQSSTDADDGMVSPTMQAARAEWEASAGEEWWKEKLRQREEEEASLDFWASSSGSDSEATTTAISTDPATAALSPAAQWQAVAAKEEWWKSDALKNDPNWWQRDREAFGTEPTPGSTPGFPGALGTKGAASYVGASGNGAWGGANGGVNGDVGALPGVGGGVGGEGEEGGVGASVKREAQYVVDSAKARLMALRLALTRSARQKAFEKQEKGPCDYQVDPSTCTTEQQGFLERKERALRGEGPLIPESSNCQRCQGTGTLTCFWCDGKGKNTKGVEEIMGSKMEDIIPRNGMMEVRWNLMKGGPCFLCQGRNGCIVGCPDCQGTGIVGYITKYKE